MSREAKSGLLAAALFVGAVIALSWAFITPLPEEKPTPPVGPSRLQEAGPHDACPEGACPDGVCPVSPKDAAPKDGLHIDIKIPRLRPANEARPQVDVQLRSTLRGRRSPVARQMKKFRLRGQAPGERPVVDLPEAMRQKNYLGGSCVHASTINLLRWQQLFELADWWRENHGHGEYAERLAEKMEAAGLKYAYTTDGDPAFLEWAIRTRRGAGIGYFPSHAINLVGLTPHFAILLDNNRTHTYLYVPRDEFFRRWKHEFGGWAWAVIYNPPPPRPRAGLREGCSVRDCPCGENCACGAECRCAFAPLPRPAYRADDADNDGVPEIIEPPGPEA